MTRSGGSPPEVARVAGLLLAAGAGTRMGGPKALARDRDGTPWVVRGLQTLRAGGCRPVAVVVGAAAEEVAALLDGPDVRSGVTPASPSFGRQPGDELLMVRATGWQEGMGASLRAGLDALAGRADAALVLLVDLPGVGAPAVHRLLAVTAGRRPDGILARAGYDGRPGHPVLLGRDHWPGVLDAATGDVGARDYLAGRDVQLVECGDVATGTDIDTRGDLDRPGQP